MFINGLDFHILQITMGLSLYSARIVPKWFFMGKFGWKEKQIHLSIALFECKNDHSHSYVLQCSSYTYMKKNQKSITISSIITLVYVISSIFGILKEFDLTKATIMNEQINKHDFLYGCKCVMPNFYYFSMFRNNFFSMMTIDNNIVMY